MNEQQKQAISCGKGVNVVYSGAGTGKTTIITNRFAYLVNKEKVDPSRILAITFTKKAAKEMQFRILKLIDSSLAEKTNIYTFHSFCNKFLIQTLKKRFIIDDDISYFLKEFLADSKLDINLAKQIIDNFKNTFADFEINKLDQDERLISLCEHSLLNKDEEYSTLKTQLINAFISYEKNKILNNKLDFHDLLIKTCNLLSNDNDLLNQWSEQFQHILVDEFQDTNQIQYELIKMLVTKNKNLFLVGDNNQMIYRWRGAVNGIITALKHDFNVPKSNEFFINQNYRCDQNILAVANQILLKIMAYEKQVKTEKNLLFSTLNSDKKPVYFQAESVENQANWIFNKIKALNQTEKINFKDMAILFRKNRDITTMVELIEADGTIPLSKQKSYFNQLVKLQRVLIAISTRTNLDIKRALQALKIWSNDLKELWKQSDKTNLFDFLKWSELNQKNHSSKLKATGYFNLLIKLAEDQQINLLFTELFKKLKVDQTIENLLWKKLTEFQKDKTEFSLSEFITSLALEFDSIIENSSDTINLLTVHAAKGLEFEAVFIYGMNQGDFPLFLSQNQNDEQHLIDELKLFYVAITRAKRFLFITAVLQINNNSIKPSSFLNYINKSEYLDIATINYVLEQDDDFFDSTKKTDYTKKLRKESLDIIVGDLVTSRYFGKGVVVEVRDKEVLVAFKDTRYGMKWILKNHKSLTKALY